MSASLLKADIAQGSRDVRFVPLPDLPTNLLRRTGSKTPQFGLVWTEQKEGTGAAIKLLLRRDAFFVCLNSILGGGRR